MTDTGAMDAKELEALIRRVIREELDNYDRDKGLTPRMSAGGITANSQPRYDYFGNPLPNPPVA